MTCADTQRCSVFGEDNRVGLHVLGNFPGKFHCGHFFGSRLSFRDDFQFVDFEFAKIGLLHEHSAEDSLELQFAFGVKPVCGKFEQAKIFLCRENPLCSGIETGSGNALDEKLCHFFGGGRVDGAIECEHSAECGNGIRRECLEIGVQQSRLLSSAARIVVLDDDGGGIFEFRGEAARRFEVNEIVVGQFFPLQLLGCSETFRRFSRRNVKRGCLVRIFSIA